MHRYILVPNEGKVLTETCIQLAILEISVLIYQRNIIN